MDLVPWHNDTPRDFEGNPYNILKNKKPIHFPKNHGNRWFLSPPFVDHDFFTVMTPVVSVSSTHNTPLHPLYQFIIDIDVYHIFGRILRQSPSLFRPRSHTTNSCLFTPSNWFLPVCFSCPPTFPNQTWCQLSSTTHTVTTVVRRKIVVVILENDFPNKQILNNHHDVEDNWSHNKTNMTIWKPNETEQRPRRQ